MEQNRLVSRIWINVTGFLMPMLVMVSYVLDWSPAVRAVIVILCVAGIYGPWLITTDLSRWRAERVARLRVLVRRWRRRAGRLSA